VATLAVTAFGEIDALERAASGARDTGVVTLASHDSVLRYLLPDAVDAFYRSFPLAQLRLLARPVQVTLDLVRANECELGLIPQEGLTEELLFTPIAAYPTCVLFPKGHALARRAREDFRSLLADGSVARFPLILLEVERQDARIQRALEQFQIPLNVSLEVSTIDTLEHYVGRGVGGAFLPAFAITAEDRSRLDVVEIPAEFGAGTTYGVVTRRDRRRSSLLDRLLELLSAARTA
jgi:LysR family transcriptional regulator, carnitine catabolism transcriptional activator